MFCSAKHLSVLEDTGEDREYLEQVAAQLQVLQIEDDYISDLLRHVQRSDVDRSGA